MNINGLTDEQKRVRIAEAMGWTQIVPMDAHIWYGTFGESRDEVPDFLADLNTAFQFAEFMRERGWTFIAAQSTDNVWRFSAHDGKVQHYSTNPSLAVAICDCLLKALP